ncbi:MAG: hypothetical protein U9Q33_13165 [Campylobacterota bacterium]|nr:hypothetical protein [Campylobacterota bacterium]
MSSFTPHTQNELKTLNIQEGKTYIIEYKNKDYFNGEETLERSQAKVMFNDTKIVFVVSDPYGMDKFVKNVRVISEAN